MNNFQKILIRMINRQYEVSVDVIDCTASVGIDANDPLQADLLKALKKASENIRNDYKAINDASQAFDAAAKAAAAPPAEPSAPEDNSNVVIDVPSEQVVS